ncbi:MAG: hypothetical protein QOE61_1902, partial [Micromonosporaceae bacterium]|nr:hypothetical protein [Micromonosporaceae bacterium]
MLSTVSSWPTSSTAPSPGRGPSGWTGCAPRPACYPPGTVPTHTAIGDGHNAKLATGDGWTLRCIRWHTGGAVVSVTAVSDELAESIL